MGRSKTGKEIHCENCGKLKYFYEKRLKQNKHFYCSKECYELKRPTPWNKGLTKKEDDRLKIISKKAREQMYREYKSGIRDKKEITKKAHEAVRKKSQKRFKENPRMYISKRSYLMIYIPGRGDTKYHHYVWEQAGKGKIPEGYHLHHKDGNRFNNKIENLQLLTNSEHTKLHYEKNREAIQRNKGQFVKK